MLTQNLIDKLIRTAQVVTRSSSLSWIAALDEQLRDIEQDNPAYAEQRKRIREASIGTPISDIGLATLKPGMVDSSTVPNLDELRQQVEVAVLRRLAGDNERFGRAYDKWQNLCRRHNGPLSYAILLHLYEEEVRAHDARDRFGDVVKTVDAEADTDKPALVDADAESQIGRASCRERV